MTVDVQHYSLPTLKDDLKLCLEIFEGICSKRNSIQYAQWPSMFYLLCAISIVQSILIDTHVLRCEYTGSPSREDHNLFRIRSAYNTLVSVFGWATGLFDPLLKSHNMLAPKEDQAMFDQAQQLVQLDKWKQQKIKSTKDFLMRPGKGVFWMEYIMALLSRSKALHKSYQRTPSLTLLKANYHSKLSKDHLDLHHHIHHSYWTEKTTPMSFQMIRRKESLHIHFPICC